MANTTAAELSENAAAGSAHKLKWGDIVLKRGVAEVSPTSLLTLRTGQDFTLLAPQRETPSAVLSELQNMASKHLALDLALSDGKSGGGTTRVSKIEALTIKQKVSEAGPVVEIQLRKL